MTFVKLREKKKNKKSLIKNLSTHGNDRGHRSMKNFIFNNISHIENWQQN